MSLAVAVTGTEGLVLAADSRVTVMAQQGEGQQFVVNFDNASKILSFKDPHNYVGAATYGQAVIEHRTAHSYIPELEAELGTTRITVEEYARKLGEFYMSRWEAAEGVPNAEDYNGPPMTFLVGGYDKEEPYGTLYEVAIPKRPEPLPRNTPQFGMTWGGQLNVASRIVHGLDPLAIPLIEKELSLTEEQIQALNSKVRPALELTVPYSLLPLQDCINLATFLVRTTIAAQTLSVGVRGVGGVIEVATITKTEGLDFVQKKRIHGEAGGAYGTSKE